MLRKFGNMITMCLLLVSTTGFAVSEHFCGTDLVSIEIAREADDCCNDGMCCHSETDFFQLDEDFLFSAPQFNVDCDAVIDLPVLFTHAKYELRVNGAKSALYADFESPPLQERKLILSSIQTYLL
jgi:hypothetical protein